VEKRTTPNLRSHTKSDDFLFIFSDHDEVTCFNDDIQSTSAITLAGILAALKARGLKQEQLSEERIVCVGAGSAGVGVCEGIIDCMVAQGRVRTREEAYSRIWMLDQYGLIGNAAISADDPNRIVQGPQRPTKLDERQAHYAKMDLPDRMSLEEVVEKVKPTVLLGLTGVNGAFTEKAVRTMAQHTEKPVVFPLSNPDTHAECSAEDGKYDVGR
jgi:malic enzyme